MDDLISRKVLLAEKFARIECALQANKDRHFDVYKRGWNDALQTVYDNAPSVIYLSNQLNKRGNWIPKGIFSYCSECNEPVMTESNFCPHCGANMKGEE